MATWAVIPVKAPGFGKTRLMAALSEAARRRLVREMLGHVLRSVKDAHTIDRTFVLGPSLHGLPMAVPLIADPGGGLNCAFTAALKYAERGGASRVVFAAADLPEVTATEFEMLSAVPLDVAVIAPDRHRSGTNALSLPVRAARTFPFAYGANSFLAHKCAVEQLGLSSKVICSAGLMRDIDNLADLRAARPTASPLRTEFA
jgi:2-phospho-L-lactate/phosphoenolpyruvate guanylyltransferase